MLYYRIHNSLLALCLGCITTLHAAEALLPVYLFNVQLNQKAISDVYICGANAATTPADIQKVFINSGKYPTLKSIRIFQYKKGFGFAHTILVKDHAKSFATLSEEQQYPWLKEAEIKEVQGLIGLPIKGICVRTGEDLKWFGPKNFIKEGGGLQKAPLPEQDNDAVAQKTEHDTTRRVLKNKVVQGGVATLGVGALFTGAAAYIKNKIKPKKKLEPAVAEASGKMGEEAVV